MPKQSRDPERTPSTEALFRFRVVSDVLARQQRGEARGEAVTAVAAAGHLSRDGRFRRMGPRTIYRWLAAFEKHQLAGLEYRSRRRTTSSDVLPVPLLDFVRAQKREDVRASLPELLKRARVKGILGQSERIHRSTLWRACVRMGVSVVRRQSAKVRDSRRYAYPHRMDLALSDGKHFRAGASRARRVAMFFLDDASRFGLHVVVGPSESKALFLRGLYEEIQHNGRSGIYYLDHGAGFIADDTVAVIGQLPALLIHGEKAYPEGHGKVEKFHQTAIEAVLRGLDGRPDVDPSFCALELRLRHWLREVYNHTPHESLGMKTPWERFSKDVAPLRFPESLSDLRERFVVHLRRKVSNDHVVSVDGTDYETPRGLGGTWTTVYRQVLDGTVRVLSEGQLVRLHPVDLVGNAHAARARTEPEKDDPAAVLQRTAADLLFERDFGPIVLPDGGFDDPEKE
jgi:transposase InsO family protein